MPNVRLSNAAGQATRGRWFQQPDSYSSVRLWAADTPDWTALLLFLRYCARVIVDALAMRREVREDGYRWQALARQG